MACKGSYTATPEGRYQIFFPKPKGWLIDTFSLWITQFQEISKTAENVDLHVYNANEITLETEETSDNHLGAWISYKYTFFWYRYKYPLILSI